MSGTADFQYRYGLSFPGQIRDIVRSVADLMKAHCDGNERMVLYDFYHSGVLARGNLDQFLPNEYRRCELVVVFLCRDYADRNWCQKEWAVIRSLVEDHSHSDRVMYLWYGQQDTTVLKDLGLDWKRDGFLAIDDLSGQEIWDEVLKRYKSDCKDRESESNALVSLQPTVARPPVDAQEAANGQDLSDRSGRLLVEVEKYLGPSQADTENLYLAFPQLILADGSTYVDPNWSSTSAAGRPLALKLLAREVIAWFNAAIIELEDRDDGSDAQVIVVLALPIALLGRKESLALMELVRQECLAESWELPPIVFACKEIQQARPTHTNQWLPSDRAARNISKAIVRRCSSPSANLRSINWWMYHDMEDCNQTTMSGSAPGWTAPQHFCNEEAEGCVRLGHQLENPPVNLRVAESGNGEDKPHALLLSWNPDLPEEPYKRRVYHILKAGVPLFMMEPPRDGAPSAAVPVPTNTVHPFDRLLDLNQGGLIKRVCQHHRKLDPPDDAAEAWEWQYVRHTIVYWDDHRFRPPTGAAQALGAPADRRSDGFISPIY